MSDDQLNSIYDYFDSYVRNCRNAPLDEVRFGDPSWETLMTLLNCIEANYEDVKFRFHRNCFEIEYSEEGNPRGIEDKGMNLKEAIVNCCFRFLSERDKKAPKVEMLTDNFLLDDIETKPDMEKHALDQFWNGYCPESWLQGKKVRMRLNNYDFYESEATGLQIAVLPGVQAIILNFRGEQKFCLNAQYGDEIENGELLSPQNSDSPPFNEPTKIFDSSEDIKDYIALLISK